MNTEHPIARGYSAAKKLLAMCQAHEGTGSSNVAERLICAAVTDVYKFRLGELWRFDSNNLELAIDVIRAIAYRSGEFSDLIYAQHKAEVDRLLKKNLPALKAEATALLQVRYG